MERQNVAYQIELLEREKQFYLDQRKGTNLAVKPPTAQEMKESGDRIRRLIAQAEDRVRKESDARFKAEHTALPPSYVNEIPGELLLIARLL
jgi:hypothetical protein